MRLVRLTPTVLMLLMSACSQAPLLAPAAPSGVVVDAHAANGRTAVVSVQSAERALQAVSHRWTARDISEYDVTLEVRNGASYSDPATGALTAVLPVLLGAPSPSATFANLLQGQYYRAFVTAKGCSGGSCTTGAAVPMNASDTTNYVDFDFTATQNANPAASGTVTVHFDDAPFSGTGGLAFASPADGGYATPVPSPALNVVKSGDVLGTFPAGSAPYGAAADASGHIWVSNYGGNAVTELSNTGEVLGSFTVGLQPWGLAVDSSGHVWVANYVGNTVTELSNTGSVMATFTVGLNAPAVAVDSGDHVWVANSGDNAVTKLSNTGSVMGIFAVGADHPGLAVDASGQIWVTNESINTVSKLSNTGSVMGNFPVGQNPWGLAVDASGHVWVANFTDNTVTELSNTGSVMATFTVGSAPRDFALDANGHIWVTNSGSDTVTELAR